MHRATIGHQEKKLGFGLVVLIFENFKRRGGDFFLGRHPYIQSFRSLLTYIITTEVTETQSSLWVFTTFPYLYICQCQYVMTGMALYICQCQYIVTGIALYICQYQYIVTGIALQIYMPGSDGQTNSRMQQCIQCPRLTHGSYITALESLFNGTITLCLIRIVRILNNTEPFLGTTHLAIIYTNKTISTRWNKMPKSSPMDLFLFFFFS